MIRKFDFLESIVHGVFPYIHHVQYNNFTIGINKCVIREINSIQILNISLDGGILYAT